MLLKCNGGSYMTSWESPESVYHPLYRHIAAEIVLLQNEVRHMHIAKDFDKVFLAWQM